MVNNRAGTERGWRRSRTLARLGTERISEKAKRKGWAVASRMRPARLGAAS